MKKTLILLLLALLMPLYAQDDAKGIQATLKSKAEEEVKVHYSKVGPEIQEYIIWTAGFFGPEKLWLPEDNFSSLSKQEREKKVQHLVSLFKESVYGRHLCIGLAEASALKDKRLVPGLMKIASFSKKDQNYDCRPKWIAVSALSRQESDDAVPLLISLVDHGNLNTHYWARAALSRKTGKDFKLDKKAWTKWWKDQGGKAKKETFQKPSKTTKQKSSQTGDEVIAEYESKKQEFDKYLQENPTVKEAYDYRQNVLGPIFASEQWHRNKSEWSKIFDEQLRGNNELHEKWKQAANTLNTIAEYKFATDEKTASFYLPEKIEKADLQELKKQIPELEKKFAAQKSGIPAKIIEKAEYSFRPYTNMKLINRYISRKVPQNIQALYRDIYFLKVQMEQVKKGRDEKYVDEIVEKARKTIEEIDHLKLQLKKDNPAIERYALKYKSFSAVGGAAGKTRSFPVKLRGKLEFYDPLETRESPEFLTGLENLVKTDPKYKKLLDLVTKMKMDNNQKKAVIKELDQLTPAEREQVKRRLWWSSNSFLFEMYFAFSHLYYKPVYQKTNELKKHKKELQSMLKYMTSDDKREDIKSFIKQEVYPAMQIFPRNTSAYLAMKTYYKIGLFLQCMKDPTKKEAIKKVLKEFSFLRKTLVEGVLKQRNAKLDYADFESYWTGLEELTSRIDQSKWVLYEKVLKEATPKTKYDAMLAAELYLECFFGPKLSFVKEGK